ncbi:hypothetical protein F2Q68_00032325 [Brassica cretica]|uniref:Retrotransposon gag domain-containing protein n=1 Tax=Brassica cretica TaxID=69181 RepID=A0A8S9G775_BRACR|nr:hypothetical protein F2Q68_00032325 [Brassica cretica]
MESRTYDLEGNVSPATPPHTGPGRPGEERQTQGRGGGARVPPPRRGPADEEEAKGTAGKTVGENQFQGKKADGCLHQLITSSEKDACAMAQKGQGRMPASPIVTLGVIWYLHFPDEEEMKFAEQPNAPIQETIVKRRILMPHLQRAVEAPKEDGVDQGRFWTDSDGGQCTNKETCPRKIPSIDAESLRSITGVCRCGTLMQARQGPRSVREYTEEFLESAKRCKPKSAEDWCRWYKAGLREEIRGKLIGVLEPWEFALVNRMAGQAMEAERTLTRRVVAISSSEEDVEVEEDPSEDSEWEEEPASSTGSGRAAGSEPEGEQKSPVRSGYL